VRFAGVALAPVAVSLGGVAGVSYNGGDGDDVIPDVASIPSKPITGEEEVIYGNAGADNLSGGGGNDKIYGGTEL
jgi:Ca2+-binding RTX toxin-like protein